MPVTGKGRKRILVVAEAPDEEEDRQNTQLIGRTGQHLRKILGGLGIDLDRDCWKTNAVICFRLGHPTPTDEEIDVCRPNLMKTIEELQPNVILLLGAVSVRSLLPVFWKDDIGSISRWVGFQIPCQDLNVWICPTYHPSYLMRMQNVVLDSMFKNHLEVAIGKAKSKPWRDVPSYKDQVDVIVRPSRAAKMIRGGIIGKEIIAFDYETNMLKPDDKRAEIVSCSIGWGNGRATAYPWAGEAIGATAALLKSNTPKIASNLKFEDRWTRAKLGFGVQCWWWDTMLAAHVIDNRPDITSIKFQAFALLGQVSYNDHIAPFLEEGSSKVNRIHEIDLEELLLYNGMDSLLEYEVAMRQMEILGKEKR